MPAAAPPADDAPRTGDGKFVFEDGVVDDMAKEDDPGAAFMGAPSAQPAAQEPAAHEPAAQEPAALLRTRLNNIEYFPPNFEGLVLGCIDADFFK